MTPDEVVAAWTHAAPQEQYLFRTESLVVACPLPGCGAQPGEPCSYLGPRIDSATGATVAMERITRAAHLERLAVFTDGRLFGYTLRKLQPKGRA